eukprot:709419-Alexandrium_andersonii.AAC.1
MGDADARRAEAPLVHPSAERDLHLWVQGVVLPAPALRHVGVEPPAHAGRPASGAAPRRERVRC